MKENSGEIAVASPAHVRKHVCANFTLYNCESCSSQSTLLGVPNFISSLVFVDNDIPPACECNYTYKKLEVECMYAVPKLYNHMILASAYIYNASSLAVGCQDLQRAKWLVA